VDTYVPSWDSEILGNVKLLILGSKGSGKTFLAETLVHGNPDIVDAGDWVDEPGVGRVLCATTKAEGQVTDGTAANVRLVEVTGFDQTDDVSPLTSFMKCSTD
jgi:GTPase SAR1 family protein